MVKFLSYKPWGFYNQIYFCENRWEIIYSKQTVIWLLSSKTDTFNLVKIICNRIYQNHIVLHWLYVSQVELK